MAAPRCHPLLLALAAPVAAGDPAVARNDRAVAALVAVLLCLVLGLALAWHHLCRLSAGRYHPRPLGQRALQLLRGQWHRLCSPEDPAVALGDGDMDGEVAVRGEEEELMPWSLERRLEQDEDEEDEQEEDEQEEEKEEDEEEAAPEGGENPLSEGGSSEALLSDLHAFSGTAAWGDVRPHVTAL